MKRVLGVLLAAFIGVGAFIGIANAQAPANCGAALDALVTARANVGAARTAHTDAEKADKALTDGQALIADKTAAIEAKAAADAALLAYAPEPGVGEDDPILVALNQAVVDAQAEVVRAATAAEGVDLPALREAAKTDAGKLKTALNTAISVAAEAQAKVNVACQGPSGSPGPSASPSPEPPPPPVDDFDCADFPLADGTTAQGMLNRTLPEDPHNLDANNNGIACEVVIDYNSNNNNVTPQQVTQVPVGGVATGDGSSL